ncbi:MAG: helicase [Desulfovibrio sp. MES5]|uniref:DISARM system SNF2-like helicase DrmD n=1 Tax=Desulfovibrio sp. MES5 TaxID=1899016 RepID=UPI000B9C7D5D|nr:DISARM system SNF2-like helicase DrmD [Desulfovibrio sp. MES5]OXS27890.1 MAG: helicase [Desulfovibrio sp. MES5]
MAITSSGARSDTVGFSSIPEPGQLVEIRRRQWVVSEVSSGSLPSPTNGAQHLVSLSSLDEDSLGEEIQVIWQLEPGAKVLEKAGLPSITGWDDPDHLEAFLDAVNWGAITNADRSFLQAPFRSGIAIEDYQLDPLVRAIDMARANLLIADDVGLGKTIEAGLVIQELLVRHRARTVFVVCPASLQVKWQTEMQEKFGLEFHIVDTEYVKKLRRQRGIHINPWTSYPRLIASMDWMKSGEGLRLLKDTLPHHVTYPRKFDILVVDEAHNIAPAAATKYALESQRTRLIRILAPHFTHHLFLSATPHNGYQESFTSLLELLDDQRFARTVMPDEKQLQRVMVRRLKSDIKDADGNPLFPERKLEALEVEYSEEEKKIHELLRAYTAERSISVKGTRFEYGTDFVNMLLKKRLFSSPLAFALTLAKHYETLKKPKPARDRDAMDERILRKAILKTEEEYSDDGLVEESFDEAVEVIGELTPSLSASERQMLDQLTAWAETSKNRADSKAKSLLAWLENHLKSNGQWNDKRVILFTEYRATHAWLNQILAANGYAGDRLMSLHGGMDTQEREMVKAAFQASPKDSPVRILLATDAASEGIDLQNHCNYLIHIEIPWNPNVMEQRNGRIDRHGQKESSVFIWHPVGKGFSQKDVATKPGDIRGDHEYLMRAVLKIGKIREDLGSVGPVIAKQIEEAMLGKRSQMDTTAAEAKADQAKKFIAAEKRLQERIARLHSKLMEAKNDFHLSPQHIARAVNVALDLAEKPALKPAMLSGVPDGSVFDMPILTGSWKRTVEGLEHPHTKIRRPITFDHDVAKGRDDIVLVHLNHPLVQMSLRLLREEIWKLDDIKQLHRVAFRAVPDNELGGPAVAIWSRLVITGSSHHRLHEELTLAGGELKHNAFSRITQVGKLDSLMNQARPFKPGQALFDAMKDRFERHEDAVMAAVEARSRDRLQYLSNTLIRRMGGEVEDVMSILSDLERSIRRELQEEQATRQLYLPGLSPEERNQIKKDSQALRSRLARIPEEREKEKAAIQKHYADPVDRTFPVAVVFLIPQSQAGKV